MEEIGRKISILCERCRWVMITGEVGTAERSVSSRRVYEGHILNLRVDEVRLESGRTAKREVVEHGAAVGILALTEKGGVLLVRQYRYAVGEEIGRAHV